MTRQPTTYDVKPLENAEADLALVRRVLAREDEAIAVFVGRMGAVRRILAAKNVQWGRPLTPTDLDDVVQDTLMAIWRKLENYAGTGPLEAWAYRFAHFEMLARLRRSRKQPRLLEEEEERTWREQVDDPGPALEGTVLVQLERLGSEADVLRAKHFADLTFVQIAERSGASVNTIKSRYYRALEKLRALLQQQELQP